MQTLQHLKLQSVLLSLKVVTKAWYKLFRIFREKLSGDESSPLLTSARVIILVLVIHCSLNYMASAFVYAFVRIKVHYVSWRRTLLYTASEDDRHFIENNSK